MSVLKDPNRTLPPNPYTLTHDETLELLRKRIENCPGWDLLLAQFAVLADDSVVQVEILCHGDAERLAESYYDEKRRVRIAKFVEGSRTLLPGLSEGGWIGAPNAGA